MRHAVASHEMIASDDDLPVVNWEAVQRQLADGSLDAVVATSPANVTYLSDFWSLSHWTRRSAQAFAIAVRQPSRHVALVVPLGNADLIKLDGPAAPQHVETFGGFSLVAGDTSADVLLAEEQQLLAFAAGADSRTPIQALIDALRAQLGVKAAIAVETEGLLDGDLDRLRSELAGWRIVPATNLLRRARVIKTPAEVARLRGAAVMSERAFATAIEAASEGATELDVQREMLTYFARHDGLPFLTSIQSGYRTALPNGQAVDRVIEAGELLRFDGGARYRHYVSDIARIAVLGQATDKQVSYYGAVCAGLEAAVAVAKPGVSGRELFHTAVEAVRDHGIPHYERSHCGHGIGIENYDYPQITPDSDDSLEPGMVICLETPYYELGWGGVQAEDTFLITPTGLDRFTKTPPDLMKVGETSGSTTTGVGLE